METIQKTVQKAEKKFGSKIYIIEDACHALGSFYKDTKIGSCRFSDITVTSFHPVKHITSGEGGALFTNDDSLFRSLRLLRSHGITGNPSDFVNEELAFQPDYNGDERLANPWYYEQIMLGYNYRITDIQCALGLSQLHKLPMFITRRREIVDMYNKAFKDIEFIHAPFEHRDCLSNFHLYVLLIDFDKIRIDRAQFVLKLKMKGIQTQVHYIPMHLQSYYRKNFGTGWGDCPNMEMYYAKCLTIPLYPAMTNEDVERVIYEIKEMVLR
jgi:dTDP-4-amino-4,6-dideoxygalactose transaminase